MSCSVMRWKLIPSLNDYYEISEAGDLRSVVRNINGRWYRSRPIKQRVSRSGYLEACCRVEGTHADVFIHRLMAEAFVQNPGGKPNVGHKDGDKLNNSLDNLVWVDKSDSATMSWDIALRTADGHARGEEHPRSKITEDQASSILAGGDDSFGLSTSAVKHIKRRRSWKHLTISPDNQPAP